MLNHVDNVFTFLNLILSQFTNAYIYVYYNTSMYVYIYYYVFPKILNDNIRVFSYFSPFIYIINYANALSHDYFHLLHSIVRIVKESRVK